MSYATAKVLMLNEAIFIKQLAGSNLPVVGDTRFVIAGDFAELMGEFYAVPIKDGGHFSGYNFKPKVAGSSLPTYDSFVVTKVKDKSTGDNYVIMVTQANYVAGTYTATVAPVVIPERTTCVDTSANYNFYWGVPYKVGSDEFKVYVGVNNVLQTAPPSTGFATLDLAVTWLNTNLSAVGTWSNSGGKLKLVTTSASPVGVTFEVGNFA